MRMSLPHITSWIMLAAVAVAPPVALADLAQSSPFLPSSLSASGAKAGADGPVELRGVMSTSDGTEYCIYDAVKRTSAWVGLNETGNAFVVKSADPGGERVTVEFQGRMVNLELRTAKVASAGPAVAQPGTVQVFDRSSLTQSVVLNPSPADEQRRLDAVAAEVRRRRQERENASRAAAAAAPVAPNP